MDPRDFFAGTNLPQPSSFPTRRELSLQATKLSKQVLSTWNTLRIILDRREASLRKRWLKRTQEQRKKVLQTAMPSIPLKHRPDFEAFVKESPAQRAKGTKFRDAYLRPYINIEDLLEGKTLLLFLNTRARNPPNVFARADFNALHLGQVSGAVMPAFFNEHTMLLSDATDATKYGKVISWDEDDRAFDWMQEGIEFIPGEGLMVLEIQDGLYEFLLKCCQALFQDISSEELANEELPVQSEPEAIVNKDYPYASIDIVASEAPYRVPAAVDFARLRDIVAAQRDEAVDHFWAVREDPSYFAATVKDWAEHRQETILDTRGRRHPLLDDIEYWNRVASMVANNAYEMVLQWVLIHDKLQKVAECQERHRNTNTSTQGLPEHYERAIRRLKEVVDKLSYMPRHALKIGVPPSPPMRSRWVREPQEAGTAMIRLRTKSGIGNDPLMFLFNTLWDDQQRFLFTLPLLMDEIERLTQYQPKQEQKISAWVGDRIAELALMAEILHQIDLLPGTAKFEQISDDGDAEASAKASIELITRFHEPGTRRPELGSLVAPLSKFKYPVEKRRTAENVETLRAAEKNLDAFWLEIDRQLLDKNGIPQRERLVHILPHAEVQRTPRWTETADVTDAAQEPLTDLTQHFSNLGQTQTAPGWTKPDLKIKPKTRGTANPPDTEVAVAPRAIPTHEYIQPSFTVSKRALKVFNTLFHTPTLADHTGEIPWTDFLHAMASTGFSVEKLYGSVWQFTPSKIDVENAISFHEPHPIGKIAFRTARRMGRRLHRAYGWEGGMFGVE